MESFAQVISRISFATYLKGQLTALWRQNSWVRPFWGRITRGLFATSFHFLFLRCVVEIAIEDAKKTCCPNIFFEFLSTPTNQKKRKTSPINIPYLGSKKEGINMINTYKLLQTLYIIIHHLLPKTPPKKTHIHSSHRNVFFLDVWCFVGPQNWWRHIHKASRGELGHQRPSKGFLWLPVVPMVGPGSPTSHHFL